MKNRNTETKETEIKLGRASIPPIRRHNLRDSKGRFIPVLTERDRMQIDLGNELLEGQMRTFAKGNMKCDLCGISTANVVFRRETYFNGERGNTIYDYCNDYYCEGCFIEVRTT